MVPNRLKLCLNVILSWWFLLSTYIKKKHYLVEYFRHRGLGKSVQMWTVWSVIMKQLKNIYWAHTSMLVLDLNVTSVTNYQFNDAILNHINSVNAKNINMTSVILNHTKEITLKALLNWKATAETFKDWKQVPNS